LGLSTLRRTAAIEGLIALALVLPMYLPPTTDHGGPGNLVVITWIALATGLALSGARHARGWGRCAASVALALLLPIYVLAVGELIDRVFLHPYVHRFRDSLF
jgi:hypothetical protein